MKGQKHTPEPIMAKVREADAELNGGATIGQVCQKLAISEPTYHRWRQQYGGRKAEAAKRLKELEQENQRLKRAVADLTLDKQFLRKRWTTGETRKPFAKTPDGRPRAARRWQPGGVWSTTTGGRTAAWGTRPRRRSRGDKGLRLQLRSRLRLVLRLRLRRSPLSR